MDSSHVFSCTAARLSFPMPRSVAHRYPQCGLPDTFTYSSALSVSLSLQDSAEEASSAHLFASYEAASRSLSDSLSLVCIVARGYTECSCVKADGCTRRT